MSHDPSFRNRRVGAPGAPAIQRALMSSKEVIVRDDMRGRYSNLVPDTANATRADAEQAVNLFFDALLRPSRLGGAFP
jgi:hypothetical protein